jgi:hypothetical protein
MNLTLEIGFSINDTDVNPQKTEFHSVLIRNQSITDLLIYIVVKLTYSFTHYIKYFPIYS